VRGSFNVDSELDKLFSDLDRLDADAKKMDEGNEARKAALDEAKAKDERVKAKLDVLDKEVKGIKIIESSAPRSARLSAVQEEVLRREGSITSSEDAKRILNNEARQSVKWGSKNLDITSEDDQKRIKEKYDREQAVLLEQEQREKAALDEVAKSRKSTLQPDKAADSSVEYKSIKRQIADYETSKRLGGHQSTTNRASIEAAHKNLKRDIKLYNQTARKRRALEKEQKQLDKSLAKRQAALDDFNKLSPEDKQEEKRLAASLGLDDPEQEAKAKVASAKKRLEKNIADLQEQETLSKSLRTRMNSTESILLRNKAPINLEEKPVVQKKNKNVIKKTSIFETVKSKVMPVKKTATAKEVKPVNGHTSRSSMQRLSQSVSQRSSRRSSQKPTFAEVRNKSTKPSMIKRVFGGR
jgi:hypothetical protein